MESGQVIGREVPLPFWRRAMPLLLVAIGSIWLIGLGVRSHVSGERLWLIGADVDLGKVKRNQVISHRVWAFNPYCHMPLTSYITLALTQLGTKMVGSEVIYCLEILPAA
jgi:hypothetical protein